MLGMMYKLSVHSAKGPWDQAPLEKLVIGLQEEVGELLTALRQVEPYERILDECADVANYVMMIADHVAVVGNEWQPPPICAGGIDPSDTWQPERQLVPASHNQCPYVSNAGQRCTKQLNHQDGHVFMP
jgi:hypothetical protein